jgi:glycosyltransferase involved in cell wall biosynthesis
MTTDAVTSAPRPGVDGPRLSKVGIDACSLGMHRTGVANYVAPILAALVSAHPDTHFFLYSNAPIRFDPFANVTHRICDDGRRGPFWQSTRLRTMIAADGVEAHWGTNGYLPVLMPRGVKSVLTIHDLAEIYAPATQQKSVRWSRRIFQHLAARRANRVVTVSRATADAVERHYGAHVHAVIHPCVPSRFARVDPAAARAVAVRYDLDGPFLLIVATLEPRKNVAATIRAHLSRIAAGDHLPPLALVGGGGWLNDEVEAMIAEGQTKGAIKRLGYVPDEDLPALYSACDAFLLLSVYEGFGMPITEAQKCGAPVIHGVHQSMVEAGGGLGVAIDPAPAAIEAMFAELASNTTALTCRLADDIGQTPEKAAGVMWDLLTDAARSRTGRS